MIIFIIYESQKKKLIYLILSFFVNPGHQVSVSPQLDFVENNESEQVPPKIHGVRVIVDAKNLKGKCFVRSKMV